MNNKKTTDGKRRDSIDITSRDSKAATRTDGKRNGARTGGGASLGGSVLSRVYRPDELILSRYLVLSKPLQGGFGRVYRIRNTDWNMVLAMKQPIEKITDRARQKEFINECNAWFSLGVHPNIVRCYFVRNVDGVPSIFSEWMDGGSLTGWIYRDGKPPSGYAVAGSNAGRLYEGGESAALERVLDVAIQMARGLRYANKLGIVHRDVKPDNVLLTADGLAKIADFGIALAREGLYADGEADAYCTVKYCSPEQLLNLDEETKVKHEITQASDIWSWAVATLEMFVCDRPWIDGKWAGVDCEHYFDSAFLPVPEDLKALLRHCFVEEPTDRPDNFGEVEAMLRDVYATVTGKNYHRREPKAMSENADILNNKALSYIEMRLPAEAEACWLQALERQPDHLHSVFNHTVYLLRKARISANTAMNIMRNVFENNPRDAAAKALYAHICVEGKDYAMAMKLLKGKRELLPDVKWSMSKITDSAELEVWQRGFRHITDEIKRFLQQDDIESALVLLEELYKMPAVYRPARQRLNDAIAQRCNIRGLRSLVLERRLGKCKERFAFNAEGLTIRNNHIYDVVNDKYHTRFEPGFSHYCFNTTGNIVYVSDIEGLHAYDAHTGKNLIWCLSHFNALAMNVSPDGKFLIFAHAPQILFYDITEKSTKRIVGHNDLVLDIAFGRDASTYFTLEKDDYNAYAGKLWLYNVATYDPKVLELVPTFIDEHSKLISDSVTGFCLTADRSKILVGHIGYMELIDIQSGEKIAECVHEHSGYCFESLRFFKGDRFVLTAGRPGLVCYWDLKRKRCLRILPCEGNHLALHPEGNFAVLSDSANASLIRINHHFETI
jgi:serine/threonine protein kinase